MSTKKYCSKCGREAYERVRATVDLKTGEPIRSLALVFFALLLSVCLGLLAAILGVMAIRALFSQVPGAAGTIFLGAMFLFSLAGALGRWGVKMISMHKKGNIGTYILFECPNCDIDWKEWQEGVQAYEGIEQDWHLHTISTEKENRKRRLEAIRALGEASNEKSVEPLIAILNDRSLGTAYEQEAAAESLGAIGDTRAVEPLMEALKAPGLEQGSVRYAAAKSLGCLGDTKAAAVLIQSLEDKDWRLREIAAMSLGRISDPSVVEPLSKAMNDENDRVRIAAQNSLEALPKLATHLEETKTVSSKLERSIEKGTEMPKTMQPPASSLEGSMADYSYVTDKERVQTARKVGRIQWVAGSVIILAAVAIIWLVSSGGKSKEMAHAPQGNARLLTLTPLQKVPFAPTLTSTILPTEIPPVASGEWFVYSSTMDDDDGDDTSENDIYFARLDGSELRRLTDYDGDDYEPDLSPDGKKVLFVSGSKGDIYVINVDGSGLTRLTDDPANDIDPAWSPDGTEVVFISDRDGVSQIYTMKADGLSVIRLTKDNVEHREPQWSPDGTKIVYAAFQEKLQYDIYVMDADGSNQRKVIGDSNLNVSPAWSPDGSRIAYTSWSMENIDKNSSWSIFSTTGERIYLLALARGALEKLTGSIRIIAFDGTNMRQLTEDGVNSWSPCWSSDGNKIIFVAESDDRSKIFMMNADGTEKISLTTSDGSDYSPDYFDSSLAHLTPIPPTATKVPPTMEPLIIIRLSKSSMSNPIQLEVIKGKYKLVSGTELWEGSSISVREDWMTFPAGLTIQVGEGGVSLKGKRYSSGTMLVVDGQGNLVETASEVNPGLTLPSLDILGCNPVSKCPDSAVSIRSFFGEDEELQYNTEYPVSVPMDAEVGFFTGWCTLEQGMLEENLKHIEFVFTVDGVSFIDQLKPRTYTVQDQADSTKLNYCQSVNGVVSGWQKDHIHRIAFGMKYEEAIFDGWDTYQPGDYTRIYLISAEP
jgi:TolB protein